MEQENTSATLASNLGAINAAERSRYSALLECEKAAMSGGTELADGYSFTIDGAAVSLLELDQLRAMLSVPDRFRSKHPVRTITGDAGDGSGGRKGNSR